MMMNLALFSEKSVYSDNHLNHFVCIAVYTNLSFIDSC